MLLFVPKIVTPQVSQRPSYKGAGVVLGLVGGAIVGASFGEPCKSSLITDPCFTDNLALGVAGSVAGAKLAAQTMQ